MKHRFRQFLVIIIFICASLMFIYNKQNPKNKSLLASKDANVIFRRNSIASAFVEDMKPKKMIEKKMTKVVENIPVEKMDLKGYRDENFKIINAFYQGKYDKNNLKKKFRSGNEPKFLFIAKGNLGKQRWWKQLAHLRHCPLNCSYTGNSSEIAKVDAVLISLKWAFDPEKVTRILGPRDLKQPYISFSLEAPPRALTKGQTQPYLSDFKRFYNKTMYFSSDSDVYMPHGFIVSDEDAKNIPNHLVVNRTNIIGDISSKKLALAFISNCRDQSGRIDYVREMQKYDKYVHLYGKCGEYKCGHRKYTYKGYTAYGDNCLKMMSNNYLFFLAFENAICKGYVSEKIFNAIYYPIVPVVLGGGEYDKILPPHSYIDAADYTPNQLVIYLNHLKQNPNEYFKYLEWRKYFRPSTIAGVRFMCDLCIKLHLKSFYKFHVVKDFRKFFITDSKCNRRWISGKGFVVNSTLL